MTDQPAPVNRPLTDDERDLLNEVIVWKIRENIARQSGVHVTPQSIADALDDLIEKSGLRRTYDAQHLYVKTVQHGHTILRCNREWLTFHAQHDEQLTEDQLRHAVDNGDIA
jgi:hypothetical protein